MKLFLFLVIFLAFGLKAKAVMNNLGNSSSLQPRVLGGQDVPRQPPWIPSFTLKLNFYYLDPTNHKRVFHGWCGSTVVNERTLLTAAHCIKGTNGHIPPATEVRVLDDDGNEMKDIVGVPIRHHEHNPITRVNDIGLVLLNKALQHRPPVELAVSSSVISNPLCRVLGFGGDGIHQPQWLQFIYLPLASDQICQDGRKRWNAEREMCCQDPTFQSKICPGDSGEFCERRK